MKVFFVFSLGALFGVLCGTLLFVMMSAVVSLDTCMSYTQYVLRGLSECVEILEQVKTSDMRMLSGGDGYE